MTISEYTQQLHQQLKENVVQLSSSHSDRLTFNSKMGSVVQDLISKLQQFTYNYTFATAGEEVQFFKELKPVLLSQYFYYKKSLSVFLSDSYKDRRCKQAYYRSVLSRFERYQRKNSSFYLYCVTGQVHFDNIYFMRSAGAYQGLIDPQFSTGYDVKLARLLANELLRKDLSQSIEKLSTVEKTSTVHWTGKKSDAVELLFALQASGSINGGQVDVKALVGAFERFFNVSLGNYYDFIKKIRMRKGGQSIFLDSLRDKLLRRLHQLDE